MSAREELRAELEKEMKGRGYYFNPDESFTLDLLEGLLVNEERYGYRACPCRLATGDREKDLDIICPCDYRDEDVEEYGACYCALYVSEEIHLGKKKAVAIPERRNRKPELQDTAGKTVLDLKYPIYRCKVCGYLAARNQPPGKCPICGVDKDRFERIL